MKTSNAPRERFATLAKPSGSDTHDTARGTSVGAAKSQCVVCYRWRNRRTLHGSARLTNDLDIVYERNAENYLRLASALEPFTPYLRGAPAGLPFRFDSPKIARGLNFALTTQAGDIDLLGELSGVGSFAEVLKQSLEVTVFGSTYRFISLDALIRPKRAAGRPKDLEVIAELEAIREEQRREAE